MKITSPMTVHCGKGTWWAMEWTWTLKWWAFRVEVTWSWEASPTAVQESRRCVRTVLPLASGWNMEVRRLEFKIMKKMRWLYVLLRILLFSPFSLLVKFTSYILGQNEKYHEALESMASAVTPNNSKWTRCYHARSDGFTAHAFHSRCDNKGPTITLVQVKEFIFGGFLDQNWGGNYKRAPTRIVRHASVPGIGCVEAGN